MKVLERLVRIDFSDLERWSFPKEKHYQYDFVQDSELERLIKSGGLDGFQINSCWSTLTDNYSTGADNPVHAMIVAKLVTLFESGNKQHPVRIKAETDSCCGYCITDGHHRIRALKYLKCKSFWAELIGDKFDFVGLRYERL